MVPSIVGLLLWSRKKRNGEEAAGEICSHRLSDPPSSDSSSSNEKSKKLKLTKSFLRRLSPMPSRRVKKEEDIRLGCYLCGQQVQSSSLLEHVSNCLSSWHRREAIKPSDERVPVPQSPKQLKEPLPQKKEDIERFNKHMRSIWLKAVNRRCELCNQTLKAGAYFRHMKTFHAEKDKEAGEAESPTESVKVKKTRRTSMKSAGSSRGMKVEAAAKPPVGREEKPVTPKRSKKTFSLGRHSFTEKGAKEVATPKSAKTARSPLDFVETSLPSSRKLRSKSFTVHRPKATEIEKAVEEPPRLKPKAQTSDASISTPKKRTDAVKPKTEAELPRRREVDEVKKPQEKVTTACEEQRSPKNLERKKSDSAKKTSLPEQASPQKVQESVKAEQASPKKLQDKPEAEEEVCLCDHHCPAVNENEAEKAESSTQIAEPISKPEPRKPEASPVINVSSALPESGASRRRKKELSFPQKPDAEVKAPLQGLRRWSTTERVSSKKDSSDRGEKRPMDRSASFTGFGPRGYTCYLCGRQFGSASLSIHQRRCRQLWEDREALKRKKSERRPLPSPPPEMNQPLPTDREGIAAFNDAMFKFWESKSLISCPHCARTFTEEAFEKHRRVCTEANPGGPLGLSKYRQASIDVNASTVKPKEQSEWDSRPTQYCCYLCGRQYGRASLFLHVPRCQKLWEDREAAKPKKQQRSLPPPPPELEGFPDVTLPTDPDEVLAFNNAVYAYWDRVSLYVCPTCGRSFNEASFEKHQRLCNGASASKQGANKKSPTKKNLKENNRTAVPESSESSKPPSIPKYYVCFLCGRQYGSKSLLIHVPYCEKQWIADEEKKPKGDRSPLPPRPEQIQTSTLPSNPEEIAAFNAAMLSYWEKNTLLECKTCGRTFNSEAYEKHQKHCKDSNARRVNP